MKLVIMDGPMRGQKFHFQKSFLTIGRKEETDISLSYDSNLSRFHCKVLKIDKQYFLEDLGSGNGTWLNGKRIENRVELTPGSVFRVGQTIISLKEDSDEPNAQDKNATVKLKGSFLAEFDFPQSSNPSSPSSDYFEVTEDIAQEVTTIVDPKDLTKITNVSLIDLLRTRLQVFQEISASLVGKLTIEELLKAIVDKIKTLIQAERIFALRVEEKNQKLKLLVTEVNSEDNHEKLKLSRTILNKSLNEKMAILIQDTHEDEHIQMTQSISENSIRSAMCIPLLYEEKVSAIIYLDSRESNIFQQEDLELITAIANQTAIALENVKLYEKLEKTYHELKVAQNRLIQTEKLSTIGTLATSIAHDIGNIITPIIGVSSIVMLNDEIDPELKESFQRKIQHLKALTQQLLSFSRSQELDLKETDINEVIEQSLDLIQTKSRESQVDMKLDFSKDLPHVYSDPDRLIQVFLNLILNAIQAIGSQKGLITIATSLEKKWVTIKLKDNGPGIRSEYLKVIFEPFFTTKEKTGTGMGLFSCKRIIEEEHNGKLEVESELGKGTTFIIKLTPKKNSPQQ